MPSPAANDPVDPEPAMGDRADQRPAGSLARSHGVLERWCHGSALVIAPGHAEVLTLSGVAAVVWAALLVPTSRPDLVALLADVDKEATDIEARLDQALASLRETGLVTGTVGAVVDG